MKMKDARVGMRVTLNDLPNATVYEILELDRTLARIDDAGQWFDVCCFQEATLEQLNYQRPAVGTLPPDPEGQNDERAEWAGAAIDAFDRITNMSNAGEDNQAILADLLSDLRHWCDRNDASFALALSTAEMHYEAETQPEE